MKKYVIPLLLTLVLVPGERALSLFGVGGYYVTDPGISVKGGTDGTFPVQLVRDGFDGAQLAGIFLYVDAIPFIDLELSGEVSGNKYNFQFKNALAELEPSEFGWARASAYLTVRKKLFGLGLPILGGVRLNAGGGLNKHLSTPLADLGMVEELLGGLDVSFDPGKLEDKLVSYLDKNKIEGSGFHVQAGLQLKLLALNAFVTYRITFAEDVIPDEKSFSSIWAGLAFGL